MLQAVELPAGIAHLDTGLADMDGDDFTHFEGIKFAKLQVLFRTLTVAVNGTTVRRTMTGARLPLVLKAKIDCLRRLRNWW